MTTRGAPHLRRAAASAEVCPSLTRETATVYRDVAAAGAENEARERTHFALAPLPMRLCDGFGGPPAPQRKLATRPDWLDCDRLARAGETTKRDDLQRTTMPTTANS